MSVSCQFLTVFCSHKISVIADIEVFHILEALICRNVLVMLGIFGWEGGCGCRSTLNNLESIVFMVQSDHPMLNHFFFFFFFLGGGGSSP